MKKKLITPGILLAVVLLAVQSAQATLIFTEDFNYNLGSLIGQGGWSDGGGGGQAVVTDPTLTPFRHGGLEVPAIGNQVSVSNKTLFRGLGTHTPHREGDTFFVSFMAQMDAGSNQYGGIRLKNTTTGRQILIGQLWNSAYWGMNVEGAGITTVAAHSTASNADASLLITEITYTGTHTADINLYVNPIVSSSEGAMALLSTPVASLTGVTIEGGFNQIILLGTESTPLLDAIRIGTTLSDVVTPIPEASSYAIALGCGVMVLTVSRRALRNSRS